ncbi:MAG: hypothetical protein Q8Q42_04180 [Nanoarchaeota archaeon]|nr:hypothetical protein [Nanoarchaeota archaeon]
MMPFLESYGPIIFKVQGKIRPEDRIHILNETLRMYWAGELERSIELEIPKDHRGYKGIITTNGARQLWKGWCGIRFNADITTKAFGKATLAVLVNMPGEPMASTSYRYPHIN